MLEKGRIDTLLYGSGSRMHKWVGNIRRRHILLVRCLNNYRPCQWVHIPDWLMLPSSFRYNLSRCEQLIHHVKLPGVMSSREGIYPLMYSRLPGLDQSTIVDFALVLEIGTSFSCIVAPVYQNRLAHMISRQVNTTRKHVCEMTCISCSFTFELHYQ